MLAKLMAQSVQRDVNAYFALGYGGVSELGTGPFNTQHLTSLVVPTEGLDMKWTIAGKVAGVICEDGISF
jgi:hypothetical protein